MYSSLIIPSPLGDLIAVANGSHLVMLEFADSIALEKKLTVLGVGISSFWTQWRIQKHGSFARAQDDSENPILIQTRQELSEYFAWTRREFTIPLAPRGTEFQQKAWKALESIPYWETRSYQEEAILAGNPKAVRAIGGANNRNPIVIIIPCHRVIGKDGSLTGYGGWMERKIWLLEHEKR